MPCGSPGHRGAYCRNRNRQALSRTRRQHKEFGAFVEVFPGKDGPCAISVSCELSGQQTEDIVQDWS